MFVIKCCFNYKLMFVCLWWVVVSKKNVTHFPPQVYPSNMTIADGPLYVSRGSHRNSVEKLRWMYSLTVPPAEQALKEPALRLFGDPTALGFQVLVERDVHGSLLLTMSWNVVDIPRVPRVNERLALHLDRLWSQCFLLKARSVRSCSSTLPLCIVVVQQFPVHGELVHICTCVVFARPSFFFVIACAQMRMSSRTAHFLYYRRLAWRLTGDNAGGLPRLDPFRRINTFTERERVEL